ncbi:MAG: hypothetical protein JWP97_5437 [Labilithrix sp.]|nr:hypothetical protein [Labilithrix sp.]
MKLVARVARIVTPAAVAAAAFFATEHKAHALGPVDVEVGAKVGVATNPNSDGINPFGFGIGARGGVSFFNVYGGLSVIHYFGGSKDLGGGVTADSNGSTLYGIEAGYTIKSIPVVQLRPQIGVGNAHFGGGDNADGSNHLYLEPGVTALVPLGLLYVGADVNALLLPGVDAPTPSDLNNTKTFASLSIHAQVGLTF